MASCPITSWEIDGETVVAAEHEVAIALITAQATEAVVHVVGTFEGDHAGADVKKLA